MKGPRGTPSNASDRCTSAADRVRTYSLALEGPALRVLSLPAAPASLPEALTRAEADVARRIVQGESRQTIAAARGVSVHTVSTQIQSVLDKLEAESVSVLVAHLAARST